MISNYTTHCNTIGHALLSRVTGGTGFHWGSFSSLLECFCSQQRTGPILPAVHREGLYRAAVSNSWGNLPVLTTLVACNELQLNMQSLEGCFCGANAILFLLTGHPHLLSTWVLHKGKHSLALGSMAVCLHPNMSRNSHATAAPPCHLCHNTAARKSCCICLHKFSVHRIIECTGLEGTSRCHPVQCLLRWAGTSPTTSNKSMEWK